MKKEPRGNALPVVLIMMLVLTVVGVAALRVAQAQYRMVGAEQFLAVAQHAAESAIASHLESTVLSDGPMNHVTPGSGITIGGATGTPRHTYKGSGPVPAGGVSRANNAYTAYHFEVEATGMAPANTSVEVVQGVYLVARGSN